MNSIQPYIKEIFNNCNSFKEWAVRDLIANPTVAIAIAAISLFGVATLILYKFSNRAKEGDDSQTAQKIDKVKNAPLVKLEEPKKELDEPKKEELKEAANDQSKLHQILKSVDEATNDGSKLHVMNTALKSTCCVMSTALCVSSVGLMFFSSYIKDVIVKEGLQEIVKQEGIPEMLKTVETTTRNTAILGSIGLIYALVTGHKKETAIGVGLGLVSWLPLAYLSRGL